MNTKQMQRIWDEELIKAWNKFNTVLGFAYAFAERKSPIMVKLKDPIRLTFWIANLKLNRCPWYMVNNEIFHYPWKNQVRAFIDQHSRELTNALLSDNIDNNDIIDSIDNYKWSKKKRQNIQRNKETINASYIRRTTKIIPMRSLDKRYDWNTVK